jgi:MFS family permease
MLMATGMGIVTAWFPPNQRGQALGITGAVVAMGTLTGPILGGIIVGTWNWHAIFYMNIVLGIIGFFLAYRYLPDHNPSKQVNPAAPPKKINSLMEYLQFLVGQITCLRKKLDLLGFVLFALGIILVFLALGQGPSWGWKNPLTIVAGLSGLILLAIFYRWEQKISSPLLDLELFKNWTFASGILTAILVFVVTFFVTFWIPFYLERVLLLSTQKTGLVMSAIPLTMGVIAPIAGWLSDRIDFRYLTVTGLVITTVSLINLSFLGTADLPVRVAVSLGLFGLGLSIFSSPNNSSVMGTAPLPKLGIAGGIIATGRNLGMVLGVTLSSAVFAYFSQRYALMLPNPATEIGLTPEVFALSMSRVFQVAALISAAAAGISIIRAQKC